MTVESEKRRTGETVKKIAAAEKRESAEGLIVIILQISSIHKNYT